MWKAAKTRGSLSWILEARHGSNSSLLSEARDAIANGIRAKFSHGPPPAGQFKNTVSFRRNSAVCDERLKVYADLGALEFMSSPPPPGGYLYVQPLHAVVKPNKKARVCVDLSRNFNDHLEDKPFKYSSVQAGVDFS